MVGEVEGRGGGFEERGLSPELGGDGGGEAEWRGFCELGEGVKRGRRKAWRMRKRRSAPRKREQAGTGENQRNGIRPITPKVCS